MQKGTWVVDYVIRNTAGLSIRHPGLNDSQKDDNSFSIAFFSWW